MKKILIYSPYWQTKGGGERYALTVAECLQGKTAVFVTIRSRRRLNEIGVHLGLNLKRVKTLYKGISVKKMIYFDGIFWVSDGSIPFLPVKRRIIHFQAPFRDVDGRAFKTKLKLLGTKVVCNSGFTKSFIDQEFGIESEVIYPPVEVETIKPGQKQKLILSVGRFSVSSQYKRPDVLVKAFKSMVDAGLSSWRLMIVGGVEDEESKTMVMALRTMSRGYPIAIRTNLSHSRLVSLYGRAAIYWHAAGYGADIRRYPERAEHFGISTVEAMAAGAVPCSFSAGGQKEIINSDKNGLLWETPEELVGQTVQLIKDRRKRDLFSREANKRAQRFSKKRFCEEMVKLFVNE